MVKRFLITTALEETWRDDEPVLFLGEWCRRYSRKERWSKIDAEVLPYHWDDRAKLYADYQYLQDFYERLLQDLTVQLNQIHGVDHSLRYWRILIGPWLGYFTQMLFDRWESIQQAISQYTISETIVLTEPLETLVPNDMSDFNHLFIQDGWNHYIYSTILGEVASVPCIKQLYQGMGRRTPKSLAANWRQQIKKTLVMWYSRSVSVLCRDQGVFFLNTYLPILDEMRLYSRFGQVPQLWRVIPPVRVSVDEKARKWIVVGETQNAFESYVRMLIPRQIPIVYLEGYGRLVKQVESLPWPKRAKLIFTSNSENSDDVFKIWTAKKVEQGSRFVMGQHGGHYGMGRWSFVEEHEIAISDCYMSWGWTEQHQPKVKPVGQLKIKSPVRRRNINQKGALLVMATVPRYSYWMFSGIVARQYLDYFEDSCKFVDKLPISIRQQLTVRLYRHDYDWDQYHRLHERFPNVRIDTGQSNINGLIRKSRLYVSTYNATTYLESFFVNVPTVIFWNPKYEELRDSAIPYFEDLRRVGIFHDTPESAARHIIAIWEDVESWWTSSEVCNALDRFKARFCYKPDSLLNNIENVLREV